MDDQYWRLAQDDELEQLYEQIFAPAFAQASAGGVLNLQADVSDDYTRAVAKERVDVMLEDWKRFQTLVFLVAAAASLLLIATIAGVAVVVARGVDASNYLALAGTVVSFIGTLLTGIGFKQVSNLANLAHRRYIAAFNAYIKHYPPAN